jgi:hypothetical protein
LSCRPIDPGRTPSSTTRTRSSSAPTSSSADRAPPGSSPGAGTSSTTGCPRCPAAARWPT